MAKQQGGGCSKRQHKKDAVTASVTTRKNKERRAKKHERWTKKKEAKLEKRIDKIIKELETRNIKWERKEGRRRSLEIKYLKQRSKKVMST